MKSLEERDGLDCGDGVVDGGAAAGDTIIVNEWDADTFHRQVSDLELQGYVARRETYRVTPEMIPETGRIVHLHTIEMYQAGPDEAV